MQALAALWYVLGFVALFAGNARKKSFASETFRCFTEQKGAADVFEGILSFLIVLPIIIALGPITLIRFKFD